MVRSWNRHLGVDVAVLAEHLLDGVLGETHVVAHRHPESVFVRLPDIDVRRIGVKPNIRVVQLLAEAVVLLDLEDGEHEHDEIRGPDDGEHLLAATAAARGALDQPRNVEDLDVRAAVL